MPMSRKTLLERLMASEGPVKQVLKPIDLVALMSPYLVGREDEALVAVALNNGNVVGIKMLTTGNDIFTIVCVRQILRWVLTRRRPAQAFALAHCHPSGSTEPSEMDWTVTRVVHAGAEAIGLAFVDHLVVGRSGDWKSMACDQRWPYDVVKSTYFTG